MSKNVCLEVRKGFFKQVTKNASHTENLTAFNVKHLYYKIHYKQRKRAKPQTGKNYL